MKNYDWGDRRGSDVCPVSRMVIVSHSSEFVKDHGEHEPTTEHVAVVAVYPLRTYHD